MGWFTKKVGREYELGKTIGKGHFSKVKIAINTKTKQKYAIKVMERKTLQDENMEEQVKREIAIMRKLDHPYIIKLHDVFQTKRHVYLVLELVTGGELFDKIVECKRFPEDMARKYFQQLVLGTLYCHLNNVAHRDLKPENLMLDEHGVLKISDFGLSNMQPQQTTQLQTMCGTPEYVAPEVIIGKGYSGFTADCWSCGVILYVMLAGSLPFRDDQTGTVFSKIKAARYELKPYFSDGAKDIISKLLVADPDHRYTLEQCTGHPWFQAGLDHSLLDAIRNTNTIDVGNADIAGAITEIGEEEDDKSKAPPTSEQFELLNDLAKQPGFSFAALAERSTRFGLLGHPEAVSARLVRLLDDLHAHPEVKAGGPFSIKCSADVPSGLLTLTVSIFRSDKNDDITVLDFKRGRGSVEDFTNLYRQVLERVLA